MPRPTLPPERQRRYQALHDVEVWVWESFAAPFTCGRPARLPAGSEVHVLDPSASRILARPIQYDLLRPQLVHPDCAADPRFGGYSVAVDPSVFAEGFTPVLP